MNGMRASPVKALGVVAMVPLAAAAALGQTVYVAKSGWFDPDGSIGRRFSIVDSAACVAPANGTVQIRTGEYHETPTINRAVTLTAEAGTVTIGQLPAQSTTFRIASYNTHLFGDELLGAEWWLDNDRAQWIGRVASGIEGAQDGADVFAMQEVWDPELFAVIRDMARWYYGSGYYGGRIEFPRNLNSGLFTMANRTIQDPVQVTYNACNLEECFSTKGWIAVTVVKDGFTIRIYNTHTQAGDGQQDQESRDSQMAQLALDIRAYRQANPSHVVIAVGDFNVIGEAGEYSGNMSLRMGGTGATRDTARNRRCSLSPFDRCTSCADNPLRRYFNPNDNSYKRLDYVLYAPSWDGTVDIVPQTYEVRRYQIPDQYPPLRHDGLETRVLSDHDGVVVTFKLYR